MLKLFIYVASFVFWPKHDQVPVNCSCSDANKGPHLAICPNLLRRCITPHSIISISNLLALLSLDFFVALTFKRFRDLHNSRTSVDVLKRCKQSMNASNWVPRIRKNPIEGISFAVVANILYKMLLQHPSNIKILTELDESGEVEVRTVRLICEDREDVGSTLPSTSDFYQAGILDASGCRSRTLHRCLLDNRHI